MLCLLWLCRGGSIVSIYLQTIHLLAYISCYGLAAENFHLFSFRLHSHPLPSLPPKVCDFDRCGLVQLFFDACLKGLVLEGLVWYAWVILRTLSIGSRIWSEPKCLMHTCNIPHYRGRLQLEQELSTGTGTCFWEQKSAILSVSIVIYSSRPLCYIYHSYINSHF